MLGSTIFSLLLIESAANSPTLACTVNLVRHDDMILITGLLKGQPGRSGWYNMDTLSQSGSNKSISRQSGEFYIDADGEVILGQSMLGASAGTAVTIKIEGASDQGNESFDCQVNT